MRAREEKQTQAEKKAEEEEVEQIVAILKSTHGSKGLEFDRVWAFGLHAASFPSENRSLEEERRRMFAAMTRARELLYVSARMFVIESGLIASK